ncbi:DUF1080 domain-containing protein [Maribacter algarum]|uniref:DUF1080 domain-containing protein n=1 Tax=Maribacter algarum (ex Zhang et al. 2020) TaxID=2578118 RepID=A0A5S3PPS7_9FLAO|nr:DUF1080 domain-containing protein [Maribacter algarum]TMM56750.1 DUF1080 domain-containing protein [Maribacter algarum]
MINKITGQKNGLAFAILSIIFCFSCSDKTNKTNTAESAQNEEYVWTDLIDEDLSKWDNYLSFKHQLGYDGSHPKDSLGNKIEPIGLNQPGYDVFTTVIEDGKPIIKVGGEYYGALATKEVYENYHFQLKFKWGDKKWVPRENRLKDSGILYHSNGEFGVEHWRSWMLSQEFQIMEAHTGDFWSQATSAVDIRAYASESGLNPMASESQPYLSFGEGGEAGKYCLRSNNYENGPDEWNTLDLICFNGNSLHIVNGEVVMVLRNSRYVNEEGVVVPMNKGKIQLQSEAAELFFKDVKIRMLDELSPEYSNYF